MEFKVYLTVDIDVDNYSDNDQYTVAMNILNHALNRFNDDESVEILDEEIK